MYIGTYEDAQEKEAEILAMLESGKATIDESTGKLLLKEDKDGSELTSEKTEIPKQIPKKRKRKQGKKDIDEEKQKPSKKKKSPTKELNTETKSKQKKVGWLAS